MKKILFSLVASVGFAFGAFANSWTYTITSGSATTGSSGTLTDGTWIFNASVDKNTTNLTVKEPVDAECPTEVKPLDFSGTVVDSADPTLFYTIVKLDMKFSNHTSSRGFVGLLTLPGEGLQRVERWAFGGCSNLSGDLRFPTTITYIGKETFANSKITSVYVAPTASRCSITGDYGSGGVFGGTPITNVTIAAGGQVVFEVGSVFDTCTRLPRADLSGVVELKMYSAAKELDNNYGHFDGCSSLTEIILGAGLTNMAPTSLFGTGPALTTVRFLGPPPTRFVTPYLNGIGASQKVVTIVPKDYVNEWKIYAANQELSTVGTTWASEYLNSGVPVANRPLILDQSTGEEVPTILNFDCLAFATTTNTVKLSVTGANLLGGAIAFVISNATTEVARQENIADFGTYTMEGLAAGTEYTANVIATNANGVASSNLTFRTFLALDEKSAQAFYDPIAKVFAFYYDYINRSGLEGYYCYSIAGASTWEYDAKKADTLAIRKATKIYLDSSLADYRPTSCKNWFRDFSSVSQIEGLGNLDVSECISLYGLFCATGVTELDLSRFKTSAATSIREMFRACGNLRTVYANENFSTLSVTEDTYTFLNNTSLVGGNGTVYSGSHQNKEYARVDDPDHGYPGYFTYKAPPAMKPIISSVSVIAVSNNVATVCVRGSDLQGGSIAIELLEGATVVRTVESNDFGDFRFVGLGRGVEYTVKVAAENTAGTVIDTSCAFSTWGTTSLLARAVYTAYDDRLTFYYDDIDRTGSDAIVYDFNANTSTRTWADAQNLVRYMVFDKSFRNFRPDTCVDWFSRARGKDTNGLYILGLENLDTRDVTSMGGMFYHCYLLAAPDITHFNTKKVTNFCGFTSYGGWAVMDCSSFDTRSVTDARGMFNGCTTIYASDRFVTTNMTLSDGMFGSKSVVGGAGTVYDANHTDKEYARIDGGPDSDTPGYFTYKRYPAPGLKIILR